MLRVLHVIEAMNRAGAETLIMNIYRQLDISKIQFDFLVHVEEECDFDKEICELGGKIYRISPFTGFNFSSYRKECRAFFSEHPEHAIVHGHQGKGAPIFLSEAKKCGKATIAHAHSENFYKGLDRLAFKLATFPTRYVAEHFMACSEGACRATFGNKIALSENYELLKNGINVSDYSCTTDGHIEAKSNLGLSSHHVFTHVGRFAETKNHKFLLKVFSEINQQLPDAVLLLCGAGPLKESIEALAAELGVASRVFFLGVRNDIPNILQATDVFLFPSISEGLAISVIEAQAAGASCIVSTGIPEISIITERTLRIPLSLGTCKWANEAKRLLASSYLEPRPQNASAICACGFDIKNTAESLFSYYQKIGRRLD